MSRPETAREAEGKHELGNPDEVSETPVGSLAQGEYIQRDNRGDEADFQCDEQAPEEEDMPFLHTGQDASGRICRSAKGCRIRT